MLQQRTTALSLVLALGLVAAGCSSGGGVTPTTVPAGTTTMPDTTGTTAAPGSTAPTTTSADPEPGLLVWVDDARRAAVETAADAFAAVCADAVGIITPREPLEITSPVTATLDLVLEQPPTQVVLRAIPVTQADALDFGEPDRDWQAWQHWRTTCWKRTNKSHRKNL